MKYLKNEILAIKHGIYLGSCSLQKQKRDSSDEEGKHLFLSSSLFEFSSSVI